MKCSLKNRDELIAGYLAGELPEDVLNRFEEHYFQCDACFKELRIAEDAINLAGQERSYTTSNGAPAGEKTFFMSIWEISAAAAVVIILVLVIFSLNDIETSTDNNILGTAAYQEKIVMPQDQQNNENAKVKEFAKLTSPAYEPSPYLEEWITKNVRSVSSPRPGDKFYNEDIDFKWEITGNENVSIEIIDNHEEEIFSGSSGNKSSITIRSTTFPQSGLYYWRIENEDEVLYVGKFYFIK